MDGRFKHGHRVGSRSSKVYEAWVGMRQRCLNPNDHDRLRYSKRGISICRRWNKFLNFLKDMGEPPSLRHSLDRKNNNKGYCKSNCRWATQREQCRNKENNHRICYRGKVRPRKEWEEVLGFRYGTLQNRFRLGWSVKEALETPIREHTWRKRNNAHHRNRR
jgi:hypothetical protein